MCIKILETCFFGYERLFLLDLIETNYRVWAYGVDHDKYIEDGIDYSQISITERPCFTIEWVTDIKEGSFEKDELIQSIKNSSHIDCKVTVSKVISPDSFECYSEILGRVLVELEQDFAFIKVGSQVIFNGNLRVDFN